MKTKIRILKTAVIAILLLNVYTLFAQESITLNVSQDAKLLFAGDDKGNDAGTLNLVIRSEWQGNQQQYGFMFVAPEFEYADLKGGIYRRYSINTGYTFQVEKIVNALEKLQATASLGVGTTDYNGSYFTLGANFQLGYAITDNLIIFIDTQVVDRKDLQQYYSRKLPIWERIRYSGFFGVKYKL